MNTQEFIAWLRTNRKIVAGTSTSHGNYVGFADMAVLIEGIYWEPSKATAGTGYIRIAHTGSTYTRTTDIVPTGDNVSGYSISGYRYEVCGTEYDLLFLNSSARIYTYSSGGSATLHTRSVPLFVLPYLGYNIPYGAHTQLT